MDSSESDMILGDNSLDLVYTDTFNRINKLTQEILNLTWDKVLLLLSDWQKGELAKVDTELGIKCLLGMWFNSENAEFDILDMDHCNATWDGTYCWPATQSGKSIKTSCSEIFKDSYLQRGKHLEGEVSRVCTRNGTWQEENQITYEACVSSNLIMEDGGGSRGNLSHFVTHMVFVGSILSSFCLCISLTIFSCYKNLRTQGFLVHIHLMLALLLRFILLFVITEPFVFNRQTTYRDYDLVCKSVIIAYLYATSASVMWMLVQGMHLNSKLTTNLMTGESHKKFRFYYILGWVFPAIIVVIYLASMVIGKHNKACWRGYSDMTEIWIILTPIIVALAMNGLYLLSILRVVTQKSPCTSTRAERSNLLSVAKATLVLFPVLGLNNLLLVYNAGGVFDKYFVSLNTFFGSTQGIFVAVVFCFTRKEIHHALLRSYNRFKVRRSLSRMNRRSTRTHYSLDNINNPAPNLEENCDQINAV